MERTIEFPKFIQALKALGHTVKPAELIAAPQDAWARVPAEVKGAIVRAMRVACDDVDLVEVRLGKKANAPKTLDNLRVILRVPEAEPAPEPEDAAPFGSEASAPQDVHFPEPAPIEFPAPLPEADAPAEQDPEWYPAPPAEATHEAPEAPEAPEFPADSPPLPAQPASSDDAFFAGGEGSLVPPTDLLAEIPHQNLGLTSASATPFQEGVSTPPGPDTSVPIPRATEAPPKKSNWWSFLNIKEKLTGEAEDDHPVTVIPPITDPRVREVEVYAIQPPYSFIRITYNDATHEHLYEVVEPALSEREQKILEFIENTLIDVIEVGHNELGAGGAEEMLRKHVDEICYDYSISLHGKSKEKLLYYIIRDFLGEGKMEPVMRDDQIEDISCDGPQVPLFLYHRKYESIRSTVQFPTHIELDSFVIRMAQRSGKHISIAEPLLDATMPDGSRLNATLSDEVTSNGSTFTIRRFRPDPFTPPDLVRFGTMSADILAYWWLAVQNGASAIYAGGTASGKTTSLNAILLFIPPQMKIVSIEDTREINLPHPNWIAGVTRSGFGPRDSHGRQAGEIDMFTLLKAALRQRPEYILVGEVRGQEAYALFQAMATGHTAYGTMHADSVESVIHRLESAPISIPRSLLESLDIVSIQIQTRIGNRRVRRTKEIVEIVGLDPHTRELLTNEVFNWNPARDEFEFSGVSYVLERIQLERNMSEREMREELLRRKEVIQWMIKKGMRDYKQVGHVIASYYKDAEATVSLARRELQEMVAQEAAEAAQAAVAAGSAKEAAAALDAGSAESPPDAAPMAMVPHVDGGSEPFGGAGAPDDDPFAEMRRAMESDTREEEDPFAS